MNGRGGKTVTVVFELPVNDPYFTELTKKLKALCGTGGSFKDNKIEIQGDLEPDRNLFIRSDQYNFIRAGVRC